MCLLIHSFVNHSYLEWNFAPQSLYFKKNVYLGSPKCLTRAFYKTLVDEKQRQVSFFYLHSRGQSNLARQDLSGKKKTPSGLDGTISKPFLQFSVPSSNKLAFASGKHMQKTRPNTADGLGQVLPRDPW